MTHPTLTAHDAIGVALRYSSPEWCIRLEFNIEDNRMFLDVKGMFTLIEYKVNLKFLSPLLNPTQPYPLGTFVNPPPFY